MSIQEAAAWYAGALPAMEERVRAMPPGAARAFWERELEDRRRNAEKWRRLAASERA